MVGVVEELWQRHEFLSKMQKIIQHGVIYPRKELSDEDQTDDLEFITKRRNHLLARKPIKNVEILKVN